MTNQNINLFSSLSDEKFKKLLTQTNNSNYTIEQTNKNDKNLNYYIYVNEYALNLFKTGKNEEAFNLLDTECDKNDDIRHHFYTIINYYIGRCFELGITTNGEADFDHAIQFYNLVISEEPVGRDETIAEAYYELSKQFIEGDVFEANLDIAKDLLERAKSYGHETAAECLEILNKKNECEDFQEELDDSLVNDNDNHTDLKSEIDHLFEIGIATKNANILSNLGVIFMKGELVDQNLKKAIECFNIASSLDDACAQYNLAYCHYNGLAVKKDVEYAEFLLKRSIKNSTGFIENADGKHLPVS